MNLDFEGRSRRADLYLRSKYPYLTTRLFKIKTHEFQIYIGDDVINFDDIKSKFNNEIKPLTTPVFLVNKLPATYERELEIIVDEEIPSGFEGIPYTVNQLKIHIASSHPEIDFVNAYDDHEKKLLIIEIDDGCKKEAIQKLKESIDKLKSPLTSEIRLVNSDSPTLTVENDVLQLLPSRNFKKTSCDFIEKDERLWFENVEGIYEGKYTKGDLYFVEEGKTSCLVNTSLFKSANLRNHLLLYDVIYCVLPPVTDMDNLLAEQRMSKDEMIELAGRGRLKFLNMMPETRLDFGFLNEVYQENNSAVVSRRALSALCAIDLVELNKSYFLSDAEFCRLLPALLKVLNDLFGADINTLNNLLLWPKMALRSSLDPLNLAGPHGIPNYGVNKPIVESLFARHDKKNEMAFEFTVHSSQIHLAHALNATYFPFFTDDNTYSDHPYTVMMGQLLNFYKTMDYQSLADALNPELITQIQNPHLSLISTFEVNDYIPITEFEEVISSSVIRKGMTSLFGELNELDIDSRNQRIDDYNSDVEKTLKKKKVIKNSLDLTGDVMGVFGLSLPFMGTAGKALSRGAKVAKKNSKTVREIYEFIEDKTQKNNEQERHSNILSKINRVARLKRKY